MKCPGQDMQYWKDDAIFEVQCPECDALVEFYKDDTSRKCPKCDHRFVNPKLDFGCASYCQFAKECLGSLPEDFLGSREDLLKDKVAVLLKRHLKTDFKAIRKASEIARHGENICKKEGGNLAVVLCSSYLHSIDTDITENILQEAGANDSLSTTILETLAPKSLSDKSRIEPQIVADAVLLFEHLESLKENIADAKGSQPVKPTLLTATAKVILDEEIGKR